MRSLRLAAGVLETNSEENTERNPFAVKNTPKNDGLEVEKCGKTPKSEDEEDEVRELLAEEGFISESIDKIIDKMEASEWFKYEE